MNNKKSRALTVFGNYLNRRKSAYDELISSKENEEETNIDEMDTSSFYAAGTGFPSDKSLADMGRVAEFDEGDILELELKDHSKKTLTEKIRDAFTRRFNRRKAAYDSLVEDKRLHAPKGGVTVQGKHYQGGWFIPNPYKPGSSEYKKFEQEAESEIAKAEAEGGKEEEPKKKAKVTTEEPTEKKAEQLKGSFGKEVEAYEKATKERPTAKSFQKQFKKVARAEKMQELIAEAKQNPVGVPGKEMNNDIASNDSSRGKAREYWKPFMYGHKEGIDDPRQGSAGGFEIRNVLTAAKDHLMKTPMIERIEMISQLQRKQLQNIYGGDDAIKQNRKQEAALIYGGDTIKGCINNCISCYACNLAGGIQAIRFDVPREMDLSGAAVLTKADIEKKRDNYLKLAAKLKGDETKLAKVDTSEAEDVDIKTVEKDGKKYKVVNLKDEATENAEFHKGQLEEMDKKGVDHTFLRIGVSGDPATNWKHTVNMMKDKLKRAKSVPENVLYVSKLQRIEGFDPKVIRNMHVSVDPFNPKHMETTMNNVRTLMKQDPSLNIVLRIRSFDSKNKELMGNLEKAVQFANEMDLPVLETKMRYTKQVADFLEMNEISYHATEGVNIKANHNFLGTIGHDASTGKVYKNPENKLKVNKHLECDPTLQGCKTCGNCVRTAMGLKNHKW